jgi:hypothetical protein
LTGKAALASWLGGWRQLVWWGHYGRRTRRRANAW